MDIQNGYIRTRQPDGSFETMYPITTSDNVDVGNNRSLTDKLSVVDSHLSDPIPHISKTERDTWNQLLKDIRETKQENVSLAPGTQLIKSKRTTTVSNVTMKGIARVNELGRWGGFETVSNSDIYGQATVEKDYNIRTSGVNGIKITNVNANGGVVTSNGRFKTNTTYVVIADLRKWTGNTKLHVRIVNTNDEGDMGSVVVELVGDDTTRFKTVGGKFTTPATFHHVSVYVWVEGTGTVGYADSVRVYEISQADYNGFDALTESQINVKYPYVDSVTPVWNPYVIRYGENLLPPFYEWSNKRPDSDYFTFETVKVHSPYKIEGTSTDTPAMFTTRVKLLPNTPYTISVPEARHVYVYKEGAYSNAYAGGTIVNTSLTFTTDNTTDYVIGLYQAAAQPQSTIFENPMLNLGTTAKPFKPREDSMLAFQTELYADHITGNDADEIFERDGVYYKNRKWDSIELDGSLNWTQTEPGIPLTGYKKMQITIDRINTSALVTSSNGSVLKAAGSSADYSANKYYVNTTIKVFELGISNADSGWGDNYTPTVDEIKAYFNGWNMYYWNGTSAEIYTNQGAKSWRKINNHGFTTSALPIVKSEVGPSKDGLNVYWTPYKLAYQIPSSISSVITIFTPSNPIISEGQLTLTEGDNQVEVGTGIVLRETAPRVSIDGGGSVVNFGNIESTMPAISPFIYPAKKVLSVFNNDVKDYRFRTYNQFVTKNGDIAQILLSEYDNTSSYSITYMSLINSQIPTITGTCSVDEKSILQDLVKFVRRNTRDISVIQNKKANKSNPAWITITLLNGWVPFNVESGAANAQPEYTKFSDGLVIVKGVIKGGSVVTNTLLMILPKGYRPKDRLILPVYSNGNIGFVWVSPTGEVGLDIGPISNVSVALNLVFRVE
jgi:hypothetical protein